jgi:hypothetical protein
MTRKLFTHESPRFVEHLLIIVIFTAAVLLVDPRGNMPLNDDWNFALATWTFAETGEFQFARLTGMSLRAQVVWGALWTRIFGASFEVLRASTLTLSLGTLLLFHALLGRFGVESRLRLFATFALLFHPIFFWSSFTYMTHVPFLFVTVAAFYLYAAGVVKGRTWLVGLGSMAVVVSFFIRQTGIATALAATVVIWLANRPGRNRQAALAAAPVGLFLIFWFGTDWLIGYPGQMSEHVEHLEGGLASRLFSLSGLAFSHTALNLLFTSIFFVPLIVLAFPKKEELRKALVPLVIVANPLAWFVSQMVAGGQAIPGRWPSDILGNLRLGPQTLRDHMAFGYPYPVHLPGFLRISVTVLASLLALVLLYQLCAAWNRCESEVERDKAFVLRFAIIFSVFGTLILIASSIYFDRYSLDGMWPMAIALVICVRPVKRNFRVAVVSLAVLAAFSIAATSEYLAWNRARWQALSWLQTRGVELVEMDGGYEINQYLLGGRHGKTRLRLPGMSVVDDRYIISLSDVRGYRTLAAFAYRAPLSFNSRHVYVQERVGKGFVQE